MGVRKETKRGIALELKTKDERDRRERSEERQGQNWGGGDFLMSLHSLALVSI